MATNAEFPPYEYMESNEVVGIDVDIAQAIWDKLDMELVIDNIAYPHGFKVIDIAIVKR